MCDSNQDLALQIARALRAPVAGISEHLVFRGTPNENFDSWLKRFERFSQANEYDDDKKRVVLPVLLQDFAGEIYDEISQEDRQCYASLVQKLRSKLQPAKLDEIALRSLTTRHQGPKEPVVSYACSISRLVREAFPNLDDASRNKLVLSFFMQGLRPDLLSKMALSYETITDAMTAAQGFEARSGAATWLHSIVSGDINATSAYTYEPPATTKTNQATCPSQRQNQQPLVPPCSVCSSASSTTTTVATADVLADVVRDLVGALNLQGTGNEKSNCSLTNRSQITGIQPQNISRSNVAENHDIQRSYRALGRTQHFSRNQNYRGMNSGRPLCFNCNRPGHKRYECPLLRHTSSSGGTANRQPRQAQVHTVSQETSHTVGTSQNSNPAELQHQVQVLQNEIALLRTMTEQQQNQSQFFPQFPPEHSLYSITTVYSSSAIAQSSPLVTDTVQGSEEPWAGADRMTPVSAGLEGCLPGSPRAISWAAKVLQPGHRDSAESWITPGPNCGLGEIVQVRCSDACGSCGEDGNAKVSSQVWKDGTPGDASMRRPFGLDNLCGVVATTQVEDELREVLETGWAKEPPDWDGASLEKSLVVFCTEPNDSDSVLPQPTNRLVGFPVSEISSSNLSKHRKKVRKVEESFHRRSTSSITSSIILFFKILVFLQQLIFVQSIEKNNGFVSHLTQLGTYVNEEFGVAISPAGLTLTATHAEYVPLVITLTPPHWEPIRDTRINQTGPAYCSDSNDCPSSNKPCLGNSWIQEIIQNLKIELRETYAGVLDTPYYSSLLQNVCSQNQNFCDPPISNNRKRKKRFLGLLLSGLMGLTGTGLGVANTLHLSHLQSKVDALNLAMDKVGGQLSQIQLAVQKLTIANEQVYTFLHHSLHEIVALVESVRCSTEAYTYHVHQLLLGHMFSDNVRRTVDGLMSSVLHGELSPSVINVRMLNELFKHVPSLSQSILTKEPSLVYQFAKLYPVHVDFSTFKFSVILEMPVPQQDNIKPLFQIANVGWNKKSSDVKMKLSLPSYAVRELGSLFMEVDMTQCVTKPGISYCDTHAFSQNQYADCLQLVVTGSKHVSNVTRENCRKSVQVSQLVHETELVSCPSGVLFRSTESTVAVSKMSTLTHVVQGHRLEVPPNGVMWFPHANYTHLIVGDKILTSMLKQMQFSIMAPQSQDTYKVPELNLKPLVWTKLEAAESNNLQAKHMIEQQIRLSSKTPIPGVSVSTIVYILGTAASLAMLVSISVFCRKHCKRIRDLSFSRRRDSPSNPRPFIPSDDESDPDADVPLAELQRREARQQHPPRQRHLYAMALAPLLVVTSVEGVPVTTLLDTGADVSIVSTALLHQLKLGHLLSGKNSSNTLPQTRSATGHMLPLVGRVQLNLRFAKSLVTRYEMYVVDSPPYACILGSDFLSTMKSFNVDYDKQECTLVDKSNNVHLVPICGEPSSAPSVVSALETVVIPPRSETFIHGLVESTYLRVGGGYFEPHLKFSDKNHAILGRVVAQTAHRIVPIPIVNPSSRSLKIYAGTSLGTIEPIESSQISFLHSSSSELLTFEKPSTKTPREHRLEVPSVCSNVSSSETRDINLDSAKITSEQKMRLWKTLKKNQDVFSQSEFDIGRCKVIQHKIDTGSAAPIKQRPHRLPFHQREQLRKEIQEKLANGLISPSKSPWGSPIIYVKKKDGSLRLCVDFRKLNAVAKPDIWPLPRIADILDSLKGAQYFSTLDLAKGFWQLELDPETKHKTAFMTFFGQFEYNVLPFGLNSSPGAFQRCMSVVLAGLEWQKCLIYLDDVLVFSSTFEQHLADLEEVFQRFRTVNLKLQPKKCQFCLSSVKYLGHLISNKGISPDPSKVDSVRNFPTPRCLEHVETFLGLAGYYNRFIDSFSRIASPLNALKRKGAKFIWSEDCQTAFELLKTKLTSAPLLIHPDFEKPFFLYTDASGYAIGAVLSQETPTGIKPVSYASRSLLSCETRYSTTEKEALALKWAIQHFRHYLYGSRFRVFTDHQPLKWLLSSATGNSRLAKWRLELQEYNFDIEYRPGKQNGNADALSRNPHHYTAPETDSKSSEDSKVVQAIQLQPAIEENNPWQRINELQRTDPYWAAVINYLTEDVLPNEDALARKVLLSADLFHIEDNILYRVISFRGEKRLCLAVPIQLRKSIVAAAHDSVYAAHLGFQKVHFKVSSRYYWPTMRKDVHDWCNSCPVCAAYKNPPRRSKAPLQSIPTTGVPFARLHVDILDIGHTSSAGNRYFIGFIDSFSKFVIGFASNNETALTCARFFIEGVVCRYGSPEQLVSDRGPQFVSQLNKEICELAQTKKTQTTSYHPAANGQIERFHRTLLHMLASLTQSHHDQWDEYLPFCILAYNTAVHSSTSETPHFLLHGWDPRLPTDPVFFQDGEDAPPDTYRGRILDRLQVAWTLAQESIEKAQETQSQQYDKSATNPFYSPGDLVYVYIPRTDKNGSRKLSRHWFGPYRLIEVFAPNVTLRMLNKTGAKVHKVHFNNLKPCRGPKIAPLAAHDPLDEVEAGDVHLQAESPD